MISITITEKLWDGIRPGSVKKTGLSEAIRAFAKANKGSPDTPKAYDDMIAAVGTLGTAIGKAEDAVKKAKDDKKGAAARLKTWKQECDKASGQLAAERKQLGLLKASKEADDSLKELAKQVDEAIKDAGQMLKDMESGALKDSKKISSGLQDLRGVVRNGLKATQKDGFVAYIRTFKQIMDWGVKPEDVPLPPNAKSIKEKMPTLEEAVEKVRVKAEELLEEAAKGRTGEAADLAQDLIADYRKMKENIKAFIPAAKKFGTDTKVLGDRFKELIGKGTPYTKLLELVQVMHGKIMTFEEKTLTEIARGHIARGDVQAKRIKIRDSLRSKPKVYEEFEAIASEEWNLIMVIYREVSEQIAQSHRQVERVCRLIGDSSEEAKGPTDQLAKKFIDDVRDLTNKFM